MAEALMCKFTQHPRIKFKLISTGTALLRENSPIDGYWGVGAKGKGKNRLGEMLMVLRAQLFLLGNTT